MIVNFSKEQFKTLINMVYVGNWMINGVRVGIEGDEYKDEYRNLEKYILSLAKDFKLDNLIDDSDGEIYPSRSLEEGEARDLIDYYDENVFWEELVNRLAERDLFQVYTNDEIMKMSIKKRIEKDQPYYEKYWQEISDYGITRLKIQED